MQCPDNIIGCENICQALRRLAQTYARWSWTRGFNLHKTTKKKHAANKIRSEKQEKQGWAQRTWAVVTEVGVVTDWDSGGE